MNKNQPIKITIDVTWILTIIFVTLKLMGIITWSWLWVISPLIIGYVLPVLILIIMLIIYIFHRSY